MYQENNEWNNPRNVCFLTNKRHFFASSEETNVSGKLIQKSCDKIGSKTAHLAIKVQQEFLDLL